MWRVGLLVPYSRNLLLLPENSSIDVAIRRGILESLAEVRNFRLGSSGKFLVRLNFPIENAAPEKS